ncbi:hypothetical protein BKA66DRAFT_572707 [Pyrenochaeta sp. MPI-SDFR-AT-0127]|nr:hypothetical protein BKA66DRAFT_572707 [Pyrenochaeta sp. MPI-SDFR-AT-0127]
MSASHLHPLDATMREREPRHEPVAIVGMACRLPGDIQSPSDFWQALIEGRSGRGDIPVSRFNKDAFHNSNSRIPGSVNGAQGHFISNDIRLFDNDFFGINNLEATYMDPQQRQLLEVSFECFESAGITLPQAAGANIGCYVANFTTDYSIIQSKDPELFHRYSGTGMGTAILANRLSHAFDLKGPSVTLDTACSSSVYALHLACSALRNGECDGALVGGANLIQTPEPYIGAVKAGLTSGTSTCHTFDTAADGYARAEGVGVLMLKRLSDAIKSGDSIRSVIRGTAVNSNGRTNGISLPSADGQESVIRQAYLSAGISPDETDYIEAHGTGTEVGDGIEVEAFSRVIRHRTRRPMLIGGVKTNLGHTEAVSGIASIIKVSLALERGIIPKTIGITNLNPKLRLEERNVQVVTENVPWPKSACPRASVNSFGYGGSNGHVILEAFVQSKPIIQEKEFNAEGLFVIPISAKTTQALDARLLDLNERFSHHRLDLDDIAHTLSCRRTLLPQRSFFIASTETLTTKISTSSIRTHSASTDAERQPRIMFAFTGQGAQWVGMGKSLIENYSVFEATILRIDIHLASLEPPPPWTMYEILTNTSNKANINDASVAQPSCTALQIGLIEVLKLLGITPEVVVGHSSGEIAAAFAAGFLSAEEAMTVAYYRGLAVSQICSHGAMAAIGSSEKIVQEYMNDVGCGSEVEVACVNSPSSVTISGNAPSVQRFVDYVAAQGVFARMLKTDGKAYHSSHMVPAGEYYELLLYRALTEHNTLSQEGGPRMVSSVEPGMISSAIASTPSYWRQNLESQVSFDTAMHLALDSRQCAVIEIGPHSALKGPISEILRGKDNQGSFYLPTAIRSQGSALAILELVGHLFLHGITRPIQILNSANPPLGLSSPHTRTRKFISDLAPYKWHYGLPLWSESRMSTEYRHRIHARHELLGSRVPGGSGETLTWRSMLKVDDVQWLQDHKLNETIVFPAAGYLAMALEAFQQSMGEKLQGQDIAIRKVKFMNMITFTSRSVPVEIFTELCKERNSLVSISSSRWLFTISSFEADISTVHARGIIMAQDSALDESKPDMTDTFSGEFLDTDRWYRQMNTEGLSFGPSFQRLRDIQHDVHKQTKVSFASVADYSSDTHQGTSYVVHPTIMDAMFQAAIISTAAGTPDRLRGKIPVSLETIIFRGVTTNHEKGHIQASSVFQGPQTAISQVRLTSANGRLVQVRNLQIVPWQKPHLKFQREERQVHTETVWKPSITHLVSLEPEAVKEVITKMTAAYGTLFSTPSTASMAALALLYCHKCPGKLEILHMNAEQRTDVDAMLTVFRARHPLKLARSYYSGNYYGKDLSISNALDGSLYAEDDPKWDIIMVSSLSDFNNDLWEILARRMRKLGIMIAVANDETLPQLEEQFSVQQVIRTGAKFLVIAILKEDIYSNGVSKPPMVLLKSRDTPTGFLTKDSLTHLEEQLCSDIQIMDLEDMADEAINMQTVIISAVEIHAPLLSGISEDNFMRLKQLLKRAGTVIWLQVSPEPNEPTEETPTLGLTEGLARTLVLEYPNLKFTIFEIGQERCIGMFDIALAFIVHEVTHVEVPEPKYMLKDDVLLIPRFYPVEALNDRFNNGILRRPVEKQLGIVGRCQLHIEAPGAFATLAFTPKEGANTELQPTHVEIRIQAVGINAKDYYSLKGGVNTKNSTCSLDFSGVITDVGCAVSSFRPGDRVVGMAPNHFETYIQVPEWSCVKLEHNEDLVEMATLPIVFATALYALRYRAQLKPGDTVLIHSAAGGAGIAALQVAKLCGAQIFATVGTEAKKDFLISEHNIPRDRIFSSRQADFLSGIMKLTNGAGVDVVFNSLTGDLLRASWAACADFGRFVDVSKRDCIDGGALDMEPFSRGATYHAFDLADLYYSKKKAMNMLWSKLLEQAINLVRSGAVRSISPVELFDITQVSEAFQRFGNPSRIGKIVVSLANVNAKIMYLPEKYETKLDKNKTYLLVGCLGGLGRTISSWMIDRGARNITFLNRSGISKAAAASHVQCIQKRGVHVEVIQGDVASLEDVGRALAQSKSPIGGVVHAAMKLDESLFEQMTLTQWNACLAPKVKGAWNLHQALLSSQSAPDFFLMTSSVAGTVGLVTESNYTAANAYLDAFARYRRGVGLPATSIALGCISDVGYLHENPEVEKMLLRKGIMAYNAEEVLQIIDSAISPPSEMLSPHGSQEGSNIIVGLEVEGLQRARNQQGGIYDDPRAGIISNKLSLRVEVGQNDGHSTRNGVDDICPRQELANVLSEAPPCAEAGTEKVRAVIQTCLLRILAGLLLLPEVKMDPIRRLGDYGMDSMLGAEYRSTLSKQIGVDVPIAVLLDAKMDLEQLSRFVERLLVKV